MWWFRNKELYLDDKKIILGDKTYRSNIALTDLETATLYSSVIAQACRELFQREVGHYLEVEQKMDEASGVEGSICQKRKDATGFFLYPIHTIATKEMYDGFVTQLKLLKIDQLLVRLDSTSVYIQTIIPPHVTEIMKYNLFSTWHKEYGVPLEIIRELNDGLPFIWIYPILQRIYFGEYTEVAI